MFDQNMCYAMCDSVILPIIAVGTFIWTAYQEIRYRMAASKKK